MLCNHIELADKNLYDWAFGYTIRSHKRHVFNLVINYRYNNAQMKCDG